MSHESNSVVDSFRAQSDLPAASRDFEPIASKVLDLKTDNQSWQQNISEINDQVDMKSLGFPDDFKILDVQDDGKLLTVSEDGRKLQVREPHSLSIEEQHTRPPFKPQEGDLITKGTDAIPFVSIHPKETSAQSADSPESTPQSNQPTTEIWGRKGREYNVNPDGSADYVAKEGDNYWSVARDVVEQSLGHSVDLHNAQDVRALNSFTKELVAFNGKEIVDGKTHLAIGETINIPPHTQRNTNGGLPQIEGAEQENQTEHPRQQFMPDLNENTEQNSINVNNAFVRFGSAEWARQARSNREAYESGRGQPIDQSREAMNIVPFAPHDGIYNPVAPIGFEGRPGETWGTSDGNETVRWRQIHGDPLVAEDGSTLYLYDAMLERNLEDFRAAERVDAEGRLLGRKARYLNGAPMRFEMAPGHVEEINVKEIETRLDADGGYSSRVYPVDRTQPDGKSKNFLSFRTSPNGQSRLLRAPRR